MKQWELWTYIFLVFAFMGTGYFYINGSPDIKESAKVYTIAILFGLLVFSISVRLFKNYKK